VLNILRNRSLRRRSWRQLRAKVMQGWTALADGAVRWPHGRFENEKRYAYSLQRARQDDARLVRKLRRR
jgi:hypothetical protein